jgi:hypothetical protein
MTFKLRIRLPSGVIKRGRKAGQSPKVDFPSELNLQLRLGDFPSAQAINHVPWLNQ